MSHGSSRLFDQAQQDFEKYTAQFDLVDDRNRLKIVHTLKVAELMKRIAQSLKLVDRDQEIAQLIGLYHDIGRFEQLKRYGTFVDYRSVDHADLGVDILKEEKLLNYLSFDEQELVFKAIQYHNKYALPKMPERELLFSKMIRDADKCDILRVFAQESLASTTNTSFDSIQDDIVSKEIDQMIMNHQCIVKEKRKTGLDIWITFLGFFFDVNFPISLKIMIDQGYYKENFKRVKFIRAQDQVDRLLEEVETYAYQQTKADD